MPSCGGGALLWGCKVRPTWGSESRVPLAEGVDVTKDSHNGAETLPSQSDSTMGLFVYRFVRIKGILERDWKCHTTCQSLGLGMGPLLGAICSFSLGQQRGEVGGGAGEPEGRGLVCICLAHG